MYQSTSNINDLQPFTIRESDIHVNPLIRYKLKHKQSEPGSYKKAYDRYKQRLQVAWDKEKDLAEEEHLKKLHSGPLYKKSSYRPKRKRRAPPPRPESEYYAYKEPTAKELRRLMEYDVDDLDKDWLDFTNRGAARGERLDRRAFARAMSMLEKACAYEPAVRADADDDVCIVCNEGDAEDLNKIIYCDLCDMAVHQECYGVPTIPEGSWLCRRCSSTQSARVQCALCPNADGALKPTTCGRWAHILCAIWLNEPHFLNPLYLEPVEGVDAALSNRSNIKCLVCKKRQKKHNDDDDDAWGHILCAIWLNEPHFLNPLYLEPVEGVDAALSNRSNIKCLVCKKRQKKHDDDDDDAWGHILCAIWLNEPHFLNPLYLEPVEGVDAALSNRSNIKCLVCKKKMGACIQCSEKNCMRSFHATCAREAKVLLDTQSDDETDCVDARTIYCHIHNPELKSLDLAARRKQMDLDFKAAVEALDKPKAAAPPKFAMPQVAPALIRKIGRRLQLSDRLMDRVAVHWHMKRRERCGAPLISRINDEMEEIYGPKPGDEFSVDPEAGAMYAQFKFFRNDLERLRMLTELTKKREAIKELHINATLSLLEALQPSKSAPNFEGLIESLSAKDKEDVYLDPVEDTVPHYLETIKSPMCIKKMLEKNKARLYGSVDDVRADFNLMFNTKFENDYYIDYNKKYRKRCKRAFDEFEVPDDEDFLLSEKEYKSYAKEMEDLDFCRVELEDAEKEEYEDEDEELEDEEVEEYEEGVEHVEGEEGVEYEEGEEIADEEMDYDGEYEEGAGAEHEKGGEDGCKEGEYEHELETIEEEREEDLIKEAAEVAQEVKNNNEGGDNRRRAHKRPKHKKQQLTKQPETKSEEADDEGGSHEESAKLQPKEHEAEQREEVVEVHRENPEEKNVLNEQEQQDGRVEEIERTLQDERRRAIQQELIENLYCGDHYKVVPFKPILPGYGYGLEFEFPLPLERLDDDESYYGDNDTESTQTSYDTEVDDEDEEDEEAGDEKDHGKKDVKEEENVEPVVQEPEPEKQEIQEQKEEDDEGKQEIKEEQCFEKDTDVGVHGDVNDKPNDDDEDDDNEIEEEDDDEGEGDEDGTPRQRHPSGSSLPVASATEEESNMQCEVEGKQEKEGYEEPGPHAYISEDEPPEYDDEAELEPPKSDSPPIPNIFLRPVFEAPTLSLQKPSRRRRVQPDKSQRTILEFITPELERAMSPMLQKLRSAAHRFSGYRASVQSPPTADVASSTEYSTEEDESGRTRVVTREGRARRARPGRAQQPNDAALQYHHNDIVRINAGGSGAAVFGRVIDPCLIAVDDNVPRELMTELRANISKHPDKFCVLHFSDSPTWNWYSPSVIELIDFSTCPSSRSKAFKLALEFHNKIQPTPKK